MVVHPHSHGDSSCPVVLRIQLALLQFRIRGYHPILPAFPDRSATFTTTYRCPYPVDIATYGLASSAFARHYWRNLVWFLFLALLRCFSSGGSLRIPILFSIRCTGFTRTGFPIRKSTDRWIFAPPRSLSQLITSFFGSWCQGILLALFLAWPVCVHISVNSWSLILFSLNYCGNLRLKLLFISKLTLLSTEKPFLISIKK